MKPINPKSALPSSGHGNRLYELLHVAREPSRLRVLNFLRSGEITAQDLQGALGLPQHAILDHLAALRDAGLIVDRHAGNRVLYSLPPVTRQQLEALQHLLERCHPQQESRNH